jgi:hypothetical protein
MASYTSRDDPSQAYKAAMLRELCRELEAIGNLMYLIRHLPSEPKNIENYPGIAAEILRRISKIISRYEGLVFHEESTGPG